MGGTDVRIASQCKAFCNGVGENQPRINFHSCRRPSRNAKSLGPKAALEHAQVGRAESVSLANNVNNPLTATNMHPYRFVFLDGCDTAEGKFPEAFGIPHQESMKGTDFGTKRGIRPRAFMGWNRSKVIGTGILSGGAPYPPHVDYINTFWQTWAARNPTNGPQNDLTASINAAVSNAPNASLGMKLYGTEDLVIDY